MRRYIAIILLTLCAVSGSAINTDSLPQVCPVTSAFMLEAGSSHIADTYLTPLHYTGWHAGLDYQRRQAMSFTPQRWVMDLRASITGDRAQNPAHNASMWALCLEASWSMTRRWNVFDRLRVAIGPCTSINAGVLYLARNGNNPCAARGSWELGAQGSAAYDLHILGKTITLSYDVTMPLTGIFFTPDYGQLYYEIWLGQRDGLVSGIWPGNYFRLDNRVMADIHFGATTLRLGYRCDIHSTRARGITTRQFDHAAVIGIVCKWLSLPSSATLTPQARIISASY